MKTTLVKKYPNGMELHDDGSFQKIPIVRSHPKQQDSLLDSDYMSKQDRDLMANILQKRIDDYEKN